MSRPTWLITALLAALAAMGGIWFALTHHRESATITLPPRGEPAYNPLYALGRTLDLQGRAVVSRPSLEWAALAPKPNDTLVVRGRPEDVPPALVAPLLAWVRGGGHLVIAAPRLQPMRGSLATDLGVVPEQAGSEQSPCQAYRSDPDAVLMLCGPPFHLANEAGRSRQFARIRLGEGQATVVASLDFLDNGAFRDIAAQSLAWQVLALAPNGGRVLLVYQVEPPSLWRLVLTYAWAPTLAAILALFAWIAWRSQSLGSKLPRPSPLRRALLEHIQATGRFAFERRRAASLHAALLARVRRRLAQREPALAALDGESLVMALASRFGLAAEQLRFALTPHDLSRRDNFVRAIATLNDLRKHL